MSAVDAQATAGQGPSAARQHAALSHRGSYTEAARGTTAAPHAGKAPHLHQAQHDSQLGGLAPAGGAAVRSAGRAPAGSAPTGQQHEGHCLWGRAERNAVPRVMSPPRRGGGMRMQAPPGLHAQPSGLCRIQCPKLPILAQDHRQLALPGNPARSRGGGRRGLPACSAAAAACRCAP